MVILESRMLTFERTNIYDSTFQLFLSRTFQRVHRDRGQQVAKIVIIALYYQIHQDGINVHAQFIRLRVNNSRGLDSTYSQSVRGHV